MNKLAASILALFLIAGCVSTSITAYKDPAFADMSFSAVSVFVDVEDIGDRQNLEYRIAATAKKSGYSVTPSIDLMPPTRETNKEEMVQGLYASGHDAVLIVTVTNVGDGPGYWIEFDATLVESESQAIIWHAASDTSGDSEATPSMVLSSYASKLVEKLNEAALLSS